VCRHVHTALKRPKQERFAVAMQAHALCSSNAGTRTVLGQCCHEPRAKAGQACAPCCNNAGMRTVQVSARMLEVEWC